MVCALLGGQHLTAEEEGRFTELTSKVQQDISSVSEAEIIELLQLSREEGRAYQASIAVESFLVNSRNPSAQLLLLAAENSVTAGSLSEAGSLYRRYLDIGQGGEAAQAAAVYCTLVIDLLHEKEEGYNFLGRKGLSLKGPVRKYYQWYLLEALKQGDMAGFGTGWGRSCKMKG